MSSRLNIGADLDGILVDHRPSWLAYYNEHAQEHKHIAFNQEMFDDHQWRWFRKACKICFDKCLTSTDLHSKMAPMLDLKNNIAALQQDYNLYFISKRLQPMISTSKIWLKHQGFDITLPHIDEEHGRVWHLGHGTYKSVLVNELDLDVFIDDSPNVLQDLKDSSPNTYLITLDHTYNKDAGVNYRAKNWSDIVQHLAANHYTIGHA